MDKNMKAIVYQGKESLSYQDVPVPEIETGEVLIEVHYTGICGTDMGIYSGKHPRAKAPLVMGHELSGIVVEEKTAGEIPVGQHVTINPLIRCGECQPCQTGNAHVCRDLKLVGIDCDGGFARFVKVSAEKVVKLPKGLSLETAALIEPLAVTVHGVRSSELKAGDTAVVIGGGPIGLLTAMTARIAGASKVIVCEVSDERLKFAEKQGFMTVDAKKDPVKQILDVTDQNGADVVFEVAGVAPTAKMATECVKIKGQIVIVSVFKQPTEIDLQAMNFRELSMIGVRVYTEKDYVAAADMLAKYPEISSIITHKLPLTEAEKGFQMMKEATNAIKVLLCPNM